MQTEFVSRPAGRRRRRCQNQLRRQAQAPIHRTPACFGRRGRLRPAAAARSMGFPAGGRRCASMRAGPELGGEPIAAPGRQSTATRARARGGAGSARARVARRPREPKARRCRGAPPRPLPRRRQQCPPAARGAAGNPNRGKIAVHLLTGSRQKVQLRLEVEGGSLSGWNGSE